MDSPIHLLTASIRIDWFSLPIHSFLELMPTLRAGWLKGVFQIKASTPVGWQPIGAPAGLDVPTK